MGETRIARSLRCAVLCAGAIVALVGCSSGDSGDGWTIDQARSITELRGMHVRVHTCRGKGPGHGTPRRFNRFACYAGTRAPGDIYETVAVQYDVRVRGSSYVLENVQFLGGPGIP